MGGSSPSVRVLSCRTYSADHYLQEAKKLKHNADALVSAPPACAPDPGAGLLPLPFSCPLCCNFPALCSWALPPPAVGQVREGRVLPGCCRVLHWVWECIGEKCSGIQVPVPYVFRNCGINQVSFAELLQGLVGGGSSGSQSFEVYRGLAQVLRSVVIPSNTGAVTSHSSCWV